MKQDVFGESFNKEDKSINKQMSNNGYTYEDITKSQNDIRLEVEVNKNSTNLVVNNSKFLPYVTPYIGYTIGGGISAYKIEGLEDKIKLGFVGKLGENITKSYIFLVSDDGQLMYFMVLKNENNTYSINYTYDKDNEGKIADIYFKALNVPNVNSVDELYSAKSDGTIYDLGLIINK